jgi:hypothetical protein
VIGSNVIVCHLLLIAVCAALPNFCACEEIQKCLPCNGRGYRPMIGIENTNLGDNSCTAFLLELQDENSPFTTSMDKCETLNKECIICNQITARK